MSWNKEVFDHVPSKVKEAEKLLASQQLDYDLYRGEGSKLHMGEAKVAHTKLLAMENELWQQKLAIKWLKVGDVKTFYFHSTIKQRRNSNFIARIRYDSRKLLEELKDLKSSAVEYYLNLFIADRDANHDFSIPFQLPQVSSLDNDNSHRLPSLEELREVVFSMDPSSTAGPDRFGAGFNQYCWEIIKEDLLAAILDFLKVLNYHGISLVPQLYLSPRGNVIRANP